MDDVLTDAGDVRVSYDPETGGVTQLLLFGRPLLAPADSAETELALNGLPFRVRSETAEIRRVIAERTLTEAPELKSRQPGAMCGERFINQYTGFGLDITRTLQVSTHLRQICFSYQVARVRARSSYPIHGPGSPPIEGRMYVDTLTVPRWNWSLWGDDTRMLFLSTQGSGPHGDWGHVGYNRGPVSEVKDSLKNIWRRLYPGVMGIHGAVYYDQKSGNWLAFTCRRPQVGYYLETEGTGLGLSFSFTLHAEFKPDETVLLPDIKLYYGRTAAEMDCFIKDYLTTSMPEAPAWNGRTTWYAGSLWTPHPDWKDFWARHTALIDAGVCTGLGPYMLLHNWSRSLGGTTPMGYEPDPNMGPREEFERGALAMKARGVPMGIWLSQSGLAPGREIDPDWFIRGVDGRWTASWGSERYPALVEINPGHPGYIAYTKKWIRYYIELGFKWFFFDCAGRAGTMDFTPRDFMRYPGDTGLMSVRFYDEIVAYAKSLDPEVVISGEGSCSDFPIVTAINSNPVQSDDGLGPRDYLLSLNRLPGKRIVVDQAGENVPASGVCVLSGAHDPSLPWDVESRFAALLNNRMFKAITAFVKEHGIYHGEHLPGDFSIIDGHLFVPLHQKGRAFALPGAHAEWRRLLPADGGAAVERDGDGTFCVPQAGMYRLS
jgi:hypothetical protein